jgi:hypothetical protein
MLYPCLTDQLTLSPSATLANLTAAQTVTARIKQERRRLEALLLVFKATTAAASSNNGDGLAGLIKEIRVRVNDVLGSRNMIQVSGPGLLSFNRNNFGWLDRNTYASYQTGTLAASSAHTVAFYIPVRHPSIAEPYGNLLSLPLSSNFLKDDPIVEIEFHQGTTVFNTTPTTPLSPNIKLYSILREVPDSVPYIPSELRTDTLNADAAANKKYFDFSSVGFLTQCLLQGYSSQTYGNAVTRASLLSAGGLLTVEYGRNAIRKFDDDTIQLLNDMSQDQRTIVPADTALSTRQFAGEYMLDFLTDHPNSDAFSPMSMLNLNTEALGGDKCRIVLDTMPANTQARITYHKLLARTAAALKDLAVAI